MSCSFRFPIPSRFVTLPYSKICIVDLFAGPGGLGEGFASFPFEQKRRKFKIGLSIEKDALAAKTLLLRSFFRQFPKNKVPDAYYELLSDASRPLDDRLQTLASKFPAQFGEARQEAWCATLGEVDDAVLNQRVRAAIGGQKNWVLIGGPPCQAYSLAGRSRNKGKEDYVADDDSRQFLYKEYLKVIATHHPAVFVMENVKGLLSATVKNQKIFEQILSDLRNPQSVFSGNGTVTSNDQYAIYSVAQQTEIDSVSDFIVKMEDYGVPQARHRIILLGVRRDIASRISPDRLERQNQVTTREAICGLPSPLPRMGFKPLAGGRAKRTPPVREIIMPTLKGSQQRKNDVNLFKSPLSHYVQHQTSCSNHRLRMGISAS